MRSLELLTLLVPVAYVLWPLVTGRPRRPWATLVAVMAVVVAGYQIVLEGFRWQMAPAYGIVATVAWLAVWDLFEPSEPRPARGVQSVGMAAGAIAGIAAAAVLPSVLPIPELPDPTGEFEVGTVSLALTDEGRVEAYGTARDAPRELMIQMWYPAHPEPGAEPGPWTESLGEVGPALSSVLRAPPFFLDHTELTETHSYPDAPVADGGPYPVVIYSHGWRSSRAANVNQSESLASHGYVVVSIDHTYGSAVTVFPDGRVVDWDPAALPGEGEVDREEYSEARRTLLEVFADDIAFVMDQLRALNEGAPTDLFAGALDLNRMGVFGHSAGGGAVVLVCSRDDRCRAGLGMDPWVEPIPDWIIEEGPDQPFMYMRSEEWLDGDIDGRLHSLYEAADHKTYLLSIAGSDHRDFVMTPLLSTYGSLVGLGGPIDRDRLITIIDDYLVAFFDAHLKDSPQPLLDGSGSEHSEVDFHSRNV